MSGLNICHSFKIATSSYNPHSTLQTPHPAPHTSNSFHQVLFPGTVLPSTFIFDYPTPAAIAAMIHSKQQQQLQGQRQQQRQPRQRLGTRHLEPKLPRQSARQGAASGAAIIAISITGKLEMLTWLSKRSPPPKPTNRIGEFFLRSSLPPFFFQTFMHLKHSPFHTKNPHDLFHTSLLLFQFQLTHKHRPGRECSSFQ
jgi:hypothetical protein